MTTHALPFSVVIPVYDEAESIVALLGEIQASLAGQGPYEVLVVDDGSRDATFERLRAWQARSELPLRILRHRRNAGQSAALQTGIRAARGEWVVTLDGDGQNDPADIPSLLEMVRAEAAGGLRLVCGHRRRRQDSWTKRVSARVANAVRSRVLRDGTPDTGCGLKVIHRQTFMALPHFDHMHRFLPALVKQSGAAIASVEVNHRPRRHGRSKYGLIDRTWAGLTDMLSVLWLGRGTKPLAVEDLDGGDDPPR